MAATVLPPIPWSHSASDFGSVWQWVTDAFTVTVNGDRRSFYWTISDHTASPGAEPRPFADGQAGSFEQAERGIRETIGKAYAPTLGFQRYAGSLATTFMLANGEQVDLAPYTGRRVNVTVASRDGQPSVYSGVAKVDHYELVLVDGPQALRILPSFILDIVPDGPVYANAPVTTTRASTGALGRTTEGSTVPGCTGRPGFLPNTVEHTGPTCPIHEDISRSPIG